MFKRMIKMSSPRKGNLNYLEIHYSFNEKILKKYNDSGTIDDFTDEFFLLHKKDNIEFLHNDKEPALIVYAINPLSNEKLKLLEEYYLNGKLLKGDDKLKFMHKINIYDKIDGFLNDI